LSTTVEPPDFTVPSTRDLESLPDIPRLRRLLRSLAMLDAIMSPDWEYRLYSFDSAWGPGEEMGSMRDGCGDHWFALFTARGAALHGLAHESAMYRIDSPWPGIWESLPATLDDFRAEPAFDTANSTYCIWRRRDDDRWHRGEIEFPAAGDPDGSEDHLAILDGLPATYHAAAEDYFEVTLPLAAVEKVYAHRPLTPELVASLNPDADFAAIEMEAKEIGYPEAG
jgi:hypothetical protein